jgi:hypothetical protein
VAVLAHDSLLYERKAWRGDWFRGAAAPERLLTN